MAMHHEKVDETRHFCSGRQYNKSIHHDLKIFK